MFDTHAHLQFKAFEKSLDIVLEDAKKAGVLQIVIPSTDLESSRKAREIVHTFENVYAAVGIHPHHIYEYQKAPTKQRNSRMQIQNDLVGIEKLLQDPKVVAVGEAGIDRYYYRKTKYSEYKITSEFIQLQKKILRQQIDLAVKYEKSLILHNREAVTDLMEVLEEGWTKKLQGRTVFHCCEPEEELLRFAKRKRVYIGVDGDLTYDQKKQDFVKNIPLGLLVLETDSPFLVPEPLRSQKIFPNQPKNLIILVKFLSRLLNISETLLREKTTANAKDLFRIK